MKRYAMSRTNSRSDSADHNLDQTGQHYMIDKKLVRFIVDSAVLKADDVVLEIGYGHGALTKELIKKSNVIAIDIEKRELNLRSDKLELLQGNILELYDAIKADYKFNKIVANIPYNISEPLFRKLFKTDFELCILTIGENFADLLKRKDNRIGMLADALLQINILCMVPKKAFRPQPKIQSAVVSITKKHAGMLDDVGKIFRDLLYLDDKKLKNALEKIIDNESSLKNYTKKQLSEIIIKHKMEKTCAKKFYELKNEEFLEFEKFLKKIS